MARSAGGWASSLLCATRGCGPLGGSLAVRLRMLGRPPGRRRLRRAHNAARRDGHEKACAWRGPRRWRLRRRPRTSQRRRVIAWDRARRKALASASAQHGAAERGHHAGCLVPTGRPETLNSSPVAPQGHKVQHLFGQPQWPAPSPDGQHRQRGLRLDEGTSRMSPCKYCRRSSSARVQAAVRGKCPTRSAKGSPSGVSGGL